MQAIFVGMVLAPGGTGNRLSGMYRIVKVSHKLNQVMLIEIPSGPRRREGNKQPYYYTRGFVREKETNLLLWLEQREVIEASMALPQWWYMSDDDIRIKFPPRGEAEESSMILTRDRKWKIIEPLVTWAESADFDEFQTLDKRAVERARETEVSNGQILDAIHRYYAFGSVKNALLPNSPRCGAPGQDRIGKKHKLGRKNAAARAGNEELAGKILTEEDRRNLVDGWTMFVRPGTTVNEAYLAMSGTFYNGGYSIKHGLWTPDLLEAHLRPTIHEFKFHGPKGDDTLVAARRLMGDGAWARDYQPLSGTARDGIVAIGQVGSIDASPIDVNLNSIFSRACPIGVGRGMFIRDAWLGLYVGVHVSIGGLSTADANLTILNAATNKTDLLRRYGLHDLDPEGIPSIFFSKFISDNGELRSLEGIHASVEGLGSRIEFVASRRADRNSIAESGHHSRHRGFDHHLDGTTKGRQAKRGEPLPITQALLNRFEYVRLLLLWIYWANTKQEVPHLLTTEMHRQNVAPTRIAIYRWAKKNGYIAGKPVDPTLLQAKLLPTFTASIKRNGIVLHRPNTGASIELLPHARFYDDYLATSGLIRSAMNRGKKHIAVKAHPEDLSKVFLIDDQGVHILQNTSDDAILLFEGSVPDLCALQDAERREKVESATQRDQDLSDQRAFREETQQPARKQKAKALAQAKQPGSDRTKRSSVRANQSAEEKHALDEAAKRASDVPVADDDKQVVSKNANGNAIDQRDPKIKEPCPVVPISINEIYRKRLSKLHQEREQS